MKKIATLTIALLAFGGMVQAGSCGSHGSDKTSHSHPIKAESNIIETAVSTEGFSTLVTAIKSAGLVEALSAEGPFTVFAPTDDAFAALPKGTIEKLLADKQQLTAILTYHVADGMYKAKDVVKMKSVATLNGQKASISLEDGQAMIAGANIVATDVVCSNGVIHVIDAVIIPTDQKEQASVTE